jgi:hypothetical protein
MPEQERRTGKEERDVPKNKDEAIENPERGLQQYGDEGIPEGPISGTGSAGTAERAAKITAGQKRHLGEDEDEGRQ